MDEKENLGFRALQDACRTVAFESGSFASGTK